MAAKEKSQQAKVAPAPQPKTGGDLLMDFDAPAATNDPPPSYDTNFLADAPPPAMPAAAAPPAFDAVESTLQPPTDNLMPPPPIDSVMPPPPPMDDVLPPPPMDDNMLMMPTAPAASAPSFEDLLGGGVTQQPTSEFTPMAPPPMQEAPAPAPELDIDESILNALDPAEREAFLEEQRKIMEQIEKNKTGNQASGAAARAAAFDQRSTAAVAQVAASYDASSSRSKSKKKNSSKTSSAASGMVNLGEGVEAPLHGSEKTQQAIDDGTALIVQCMSCNNWMQVTQEAEVMFCPICQTVCHVEKKGAAKASDMEAAAQMAADAELAEKLQKEEYSRAQEGGGSSSRRRQQRAAAPAPASSASGEQSWYDWLTGAPAPAPVPARGSSEIRPQRGLVAATTGEEFASRSRSYDESEGLMGGGGARVAQQKSMFACVTDSIADAANQMTGMTLSEDQEGNVHGVDGSSLLAMPDVSRQREEGGN